ncbi:hypothetical protein [Candidatus Poriferisodalis sp.]|uniref:hypothetical protein n=1 Tax=Candidatus Poriferisodalis sp. TaxID=3101277 RepID=UPI003B015C58
MSDAAPLFEAAAGLGSLQTVMAINEARWSDDSDSAAFDDDGSEDLYCEHCHGAALEAVFLSLAPEDLPTVGERGAQIVTGWRAAAKRRWPKQP